MTATRWWLRGHSTLSLLIVMLALANNEGGTFGLVVGACAILAILVIWLWAEQRLPKTGAYETPEGLRVVKLSGSEFARWDSIAAFEVPPRWPHRVTVLGTNGRRVQLIGFRQGVPIAWQTGDTRDIVAVLNERLALWKAAATVGPAYLPTS